MTIIKMFIRQNFEKSYKVFISYELIITHLLYLHITYTFIN